MTDLTFSDRLFIGLARWVENPTLRFVGPQRVLRAIFAITAPLGSHVPRGTQMTRQPDGSLHIRPPGIAADAPVLYYLHGGGFTIGGPRTHAALVAHLAQAAGMRAVAQRYRLAPEHPFPAARQDAIAGYRALVEGGTPPAAIAGDSAGGCLALQVACHARDDGLPMPHAMALIGPIGDLSGSIEDRFEQAEDEILIPPAWPRRIREVYLPGIDPARADVSPLSGDLTGLPPTLIQAASGEALAGDARRLADAMEDVTLDLWPDLQHVWHLHAGYGAAAGRALSQMGAFLARHSAP